MVYPYCSRHGHQEGQKKDVTWISERWVFSVNFFWQFFWSMRNVAPKNRHLRPLHKVRFCQFWPHRSSLWIIAQKASPAKCQFPFLIPNRNSFHTNHINQRERWESPATRGEGNIGRPLVAELTHRCTRLQDGFCNPISTCNTRRSIDGTCRGAKACNSLLAFDGGDWATWLAQWHHYCYLTWRPEISSAASTFKHRWCPLFQPLIFFILTFFFGGYQWVEPTWNSELVRWPRSSGHLFSWHPRGPRGWFFSRLSSLDSFTLKKFANFSED